MLVIKTSQDTIEIPLETYSGVTVELSGGIDSAALLYLMCEYIEDNSLDTRIYAITIPNKNDSACVYHAILVLNFIRMRFKNIKIEHIIKAVTRNGGVKIKLMRDISDDLFYEGKIQAHFNAVTANPKSDFTFKDPGKYYQHPLKNRDFTERKQLEIIYERGLVHWEPFKNIDKRGICEITEMKNITHRLLLITKSCTDLYEYICGTCWWCQERAWGFNIEYTGKSNRTFRFK